MSRAGVNANGTVEMEDDFPVAALESVKLTLPAAFETEIFAAELLDNLAAYHKSAMGARAARHQGDHQTAERLARQAALCKTAAALIQHDYPETVEVYQHLARLRAQTFKADRARLLEGENA